MLQFHVVITTCLFIPTELVGVVVLDKVEVSVFGLIA